MPIVAVDSSGIVGQPPVYMAAVRYTDKQKHSIIHLDIMQEQKYKKQIRSDWKLILSSILIFKAVENLIKSNDIIQIDTDFQGKDKEKIKYYLKKLFGHKYNGNKLANPIIQFIPSRYSEDVKKADKKSKLARHKKIDRIKCPNLKKELEILC